MIWSTETAVRTEGKLMSTTHTYPNERDEFLTRVLIWTDKRQPRPKGKCHNYSKETNVK